MPKISPDLAAAIRRMPPDRKDKLLLRLVAKDKILIEQLNFELLEAQSTVEDRVEDLKKLITKELNEVEKYYFTPGNLMMTMRSLNARITEHVKITKDKLSEVMLTLFLLTRPFELYFNRLQQFPSYRSDTFAEYVLRRTQFVIKKAEKLHEDYYIEFREDLQKLLDFIYTYKPTAVQVKDTDIPRHWEM